MMRTAISWEIAVRTFLTSAYPQVGLALPVFENSGFNT